jgi:hypothetical protein
MERKEKFNEKKTNGASRERKKDRPFVVRQEKLAVSLFSEKNLAATQKGEEEAVVPED